MVSECIFYVRFFTKYIDKEKVVAVKTSRQAICTLGLGARDIVRLSENRKFLFENSCHNFHVCMIVQKCLF
jgi:hypothetical protein